MRRYITLLCFVILALGLAVPAHAHEVSRDDRDDDDSDSFTLWATETYFALVSPDGTVTEDFEEEEFDPQVGTRFFSIDTLYSDADRTDEVGTNRIECVVTRAGGETEEDFFADLLCNGVVRLDDRGDISWQTAVSFTAETADTDDPFVVIALTGGTDEFIGASGQVDVFDESDDDVEETLSRYEITLLR